MNRFTVDSGHSTVIVAARSSMGAVVFQTQELHGSIEASITDGVVSASEGPRATLEIDLRSLRSGNDVYDAELIRRIDARRFPVCSLTMESVEALTSTRLAIRGSMEFHGVTTATSGVVEIESASDDRLVVTGTKELDIRDFDIPAPRVLMMKIYPEVQVQLFLEARSATG